jgi:hypothetical protein
MVEFTQEHFSNLTKVCLPVKILYQTDRVIILIHLQMAVTRRQLKDHLLYQPRLITTSFLTALKFK